MDNPLYIGIGVIILFTVFILVFISRRIVTVDIDKALIISGARGDSSDLSDDNSGNYSTKGDNSVKVVPPGGRVFVIPVIQSAKEISLTQIAINLDVEGVDKLNIPIQVRGKANIKVNRDAESIRNAAERFDNGSLSFTEAIRANVENVLVGSLRAIIAEMTVKDLLNKRLEFSSRVKEIAENEIRVMGLVIDALTINEISDPNGYIKSLSIPETEEVKKLARIATANAEQAANETEVQTRISIAERNKELEIRQAQLKSETDIALSKANAAGPLQDAEQQKAIALIEKEAAEAKALLREQELDAEVRKPADAAKYKAEKEAEANKINSILAAEAKAETIKLEAEANKIKGTAEADVIKAKGAAEADARTALANSFKEYNEAAIIQTIIDKLPEVARELAQPMGNIKDLTVISTEGANALTSGVANNMGTLDSVVKSLTGVGVSDLLQKLVDKGPAPKQGSTRVTPRKTQN